MNPQREAQIRWGQLRQVLQQAADIAGGASPELFVSFSPEVQMAWVNQVQTRLVSASRLARELNSLLGVES